MTPDRAAECWQASVVVLTETAVVLDFLLLVARVQSDWLTACQQASTIPFTKPAQSCI